MRVLFEHHESFHSLAAIWIVYTDHCGFLHCRVSEQHVFNFRGIDVEAAHQDQVFLALDDVEVTILVHARHVARVKPTVANSLSRLLGFVPVALHHLRATDAQLALLALWHFANAVFKIHYLAFSTDDRKTDAARFAFRERRRR